MEKTDKDKPVESLVIQMLKGASPVDRVAAASALGEMGGPTAVQFLAAVLTDVGDEDSVIGEVAEALGKIGSHTAVYALVTYLVKNAEWGLWDGTMEKVSVALREAGDSAVEPLVAALSSADKARLEGVIRALAIIGDERAVEPLIALLEDKSEYIYCSHVRKGAASALGMIGASQAVGPLIAVALCQEDCARWAAVEALGEIGNPEAVGPLIKLLARQEDYRIRGYAAKALGKIGDSTAVEPLLELLEAKYQGDGEWIWDNAAWALGQIGDDRAIGPLLRYVKALKAQWSGDEDPQQGHDSLKLVIQALDKIGFLDGYEEDAEKGQS